MDEAQAPPKRRRSLRWLAWLALAGILAATGGVSYWYWLRPDLGRIAALATLDAAALRADVERLDGTARAQAERIAQGGRERAALRTEIARLERALAAAEAAPPVSQPPAPSAPPPTPKRWRLAEAEYLLRIANQRLLLERDAAGAIRLLRAADAILAALDDPALHAARAAIADELAALSAFKGVDTQGIFLRLEAAKALLDDLPLRLPQYAAPPPPSPPPADGASMLEHLRQRLSGLVRFRNHAEPVRPLLPPEEAEYLEQRLRLTMERAQLALLRRDQRIYRASLADARAHLARFVNSHSASAAAALAEIESLLAVAVDASPPDISGPSGSLARLREAGGGP